MTFSFGTYNFTKDHVSVLNYFRIDDICKIEMFDNNNAFTICAVGSATALPVHKIPNASLLQLAKLAKFMKEQSANVNKNTAIICNIYIFPHPFLREAQNVIK